MPQQRCPEPVPGFGQEVPGVFGLSRIHASRYLPDGLMNRNWRLDTAEGSFALKELLDVGVPQARRNLAVLTRLARAGLPIPVPVSSSTGDLVVETGGRAFYLFPWIEGARIPGTELTLSQVEDLGVLLGRLHLRLNDTSIGLPGPEPDPSTVRTAEDAYDQIDRFEATIAKRRHRDPFDVKAAEALRRRRLLLEAHRDSQPTDDGPDAPTGWIHGDFHSSNLLWNDGRVVGILDWDRLRAQPLGDEVVRAAVLHFKADDGQLDLHRVTAFVGGYRSGIRIGADALAHALHRLWWHHLTSFWILGFHYDREDFGCDYLLEPRERLAHWWTEHRYEVRSAFTN